MAESITHHEEFFRGSDAVKKLGNAQMAVFGVGAIGSNLVDNLLRQGLRNMAVLDKDRVDRHNIGTQAYGTADVGKTKVDALAQRMYEATGADLATFSTEVNSGNVKKFLKGHDLVVDAFDNSESRLLLQEACRKHGMPCLHAGLYESYGEVVWDEDYRVPRDAQGDVCDYPLARNIIMLTAAVLSEAVICFLLEGVRRSFRITLRDLKIKEL